MSLAQQIEALLEKLVNEQAVEAVEQVLKERVVQAVKDAIAEEGIGEQVEAEFAEQLQKLDCSERVEHAFGEFDFAAAFKERLREVDLLATLVASLPWTNLVQNVATSELVERAVSAMVIRYLEVLKTQVQLPELLELPPLTIQLTVPPAPVPVKKSWFGWLTSARHGLQ